VIIRTFNEEAHLPALFDGIERQDYRDLEVLVVDSGSIDRTREIAQRRAPIVLRVHPHDFTFGHSLNTGISGSRGRFAVIVSAHTIPTDSRWLSNLVAPLREADVAMSYGRQLGWITSKLGERLDLDRTFGSQPRQLRAPNFFANNANAAIRRELWERHRFDETLPGLEDIEWAKHWMELGYRVVYEPDAAIYHIHAETWAQVRHRYHREGQAGRWIGLTGRRNLPGIALSAAGHLLADLNHVRKNGLVRAQAGEVVRFRFEKLIGTAAGIWDGAKMENPSVKQKMFYGKPYQAVVIEGQGRASLQRRAPATLKPGDALVRVAYAGVCATDLEILDGHLGYYKTGLAKYPIVPGHEFSGTVAGVGARVSDLAEGDRVVVECIQGCGSCEACRRRNFIGCIERTEVGVIGLDGGYAEYMVTPARFVHQLPPDVTLRQACLCEPMAVVLKGLTRLSASWGQDAGCRKCAVVGAGTIGHLTARILRSRGHDVTVFDRDPGRLAYFDRSGIATSDGLSELANFEAVVEATGDPDALHSILHLSQAGSTLLLLGLPYAKREFSFETVVGFDKTVVGSVGSAAEHFEAALEMLPRLDVTPFLRQSFPLADFQHAWAAARSKRHLKVILSIDEDAEHQ
jgi:threonine dehydrogenase-like Zn-dependent dehydrogenase/GT2 family glycosyltransferase